MKKYKSLFIWIFAVIFTLCIATYQKMTGPTYPMKGEVTLNNAEIKFKLPRSSDNQSGEKVVINVPDTKVTGIMTYQRYMDPNDSLKPVALTREGENLVATIPPQPAAGKIQYYITLESGSEKVNLTDENGVVIRYKGVVPLYILIPHVILMFLAMLLSTRTGLEVLFKGKNTFLYTVLTLFCLIPGGMILGPFVQKFAFDAYWTGWPFQGILHFGDMTDNKTAIAFLGWIIALLVQIFMKRKGKGMALVASLVLFLVYMIPHSVLGSHIDYAKQKAASPKTEVQDSIK